MSNELASTGVVDRTLGTGDHKTVGRLWIFSGLAVGVAALVLRLLAALEQLDAGSVALFEDLDEFVQVWSLSRDLLIFGGVAAVLVGLGTFIVPLQVGANTIAFPRGATAAFWVWAASLLMVVASYIGNGGPGGGRVDFVTLWALALGGMLFALVWALICIASTVLGARAPGMTLEMVPVTAWSYLVFALLGILALPVQMAQLVIAFLDVRGGYMPIVETTPLSAVMDTITLAPSVYWLLIPTLGIALDIIGVHTGRPLRFHRSTLVLIGLLGLTAFGASVTAFGGRRGSVDFNNAFMVLGLLESVLPLLGALALGGESLRSGTPSFRVPLLAGLTSGLLALGGATLALLGAVEPIVGFFAKLADRTPDVPDVLTVNGTTFNAGVTAAIVTAALVGAVAGLQHWGHKIWGHQMGEGGGSLAVLALAGGGMVWAAGEVLGGLGDQPALPAVADLDANMVTIGNILVVAGVAAAAAGVALALLNTAMSGVLGRGSVAEPWSGRTLEWLTDSPPPFANFESQPVVKSASPLDHMDRSPATSTPIPEEVTA
ncbi:MAG: hypothetical protein HKN03_19160 [Acidimicrobiales bacterium]|nr:hypothetical protein [Acidimicrobiales bacterium]